MDEIDSGGLEVIATGVFQTLSKEGLHTITIVYGGQPYIFDLVFESSGQKKPNLNIVMVDESKNRLKLTFTDFDNSLGIFNRAPLDIGIIDSKKLFANFNIVELQNARKQVFYTFYLERKAND